MPTLMLPNVHVRLTMSLILMPRVLAIRMVTARAKVVVMTSMITGVEARVWASPTFHSLQYSVCIFFSGGGDGLLKHGCAEGGDESKQQPWAAQIAGLVALWILHGTLTAVGYGREGF